ncbi:acyl-CoA dehydrogenase family protein [Halioxenophilus sp. WMMB6]|uniref:acyl-CoA dehydrogenase family protein n=1 Tax=Halioxenophilus sp. WMMB6 TaxID=3073815 RepID=UPI00295F1560|nr:acyl-CoA dehydrogenase family protein [Halioxenophilus sp. WMMB6]
MESLSPLLGKVLPAPELEKSELALLAEAEAVISEQLAPLAISNDQRGRYPTESMACLRHTPLFKLAVPKSLGGYGVSHACSLEAQLRLAMVDCSVAQLFKVHDELVREIFAYCPEFQQARLANSILNENHVLGLAVAEAGRSAVEPLNTRAIAQADGSFVVTGSKIYTTAAAEADQIATWGFNPAAATEENPVLGMQLLLIPKGTPGVDIQRDWNALGQRATDSGSIQFNEVVCPPEWVASVPGKAPLIHSSLRYQAGFSALLVGMGLGAIAAALPFIQEKSRPWAATGVDQAVNDPFIRRNIGKYVADLTNAYALVQRCGRLLDSFERGEIDRGQLAMPISAAKVAANESALAATSAIHGLMGTRSVAGKQPFDYWWRNARTLSLHDPVEWKMHEIGRHLLTGWEPEPGIYQ